MKKNLTLILLFLFAICCNKSFAFNDSIKTQNHFHKIYFFTVGLRAYDESCGSCRDIEAAKMGFGYKRKAGCVVGPIKYARVHSHNKRVEAKMKKRFGNDWREQYDVLLASCKV